MRHVSNIAKMGISASTPTHISLGFMSPDSKFHKREFDAPALMVEVQAFIADIKARGMRIESNGAPSVVIVIKTDSNTEVNYGRLEALQRWMETLPRAPVVYPMVNIMYVEDGSKSHAVMSSVIRRLWTPFSAAIGAQTLRLWDRTPVDHSSWWS